MVCLCFDFFFDLLIRCIYYICSFIHKKYTWSENKYEIFVDFMMEYWMFRYTIIIISSN